MVPNYKRPSIREYFNEVWETGPTDQDIDMLLYLEECERRSKILDKVLDHPMYTDDCPLGVLDTEDIEKLCDCEHCGDTNVDCWLKWFGKDIEDERNTR